MRKGQHKVVTPLNIASSGNFASAKLSKQGKETLPGYGIVRELGSGATATVFLAKDIRNARYVALKILTPKNVADKNILNKFLFEAELLKKFVHPNIVKGFDYGSFEDIFFLAVEYVDGISLRSVIDSNGALQYERAIDIILQVAKAIEYMESQGYIHRDIKPDNILISKNGVAKLCDLGFAQPITQIKGVSETTNGTVQYMSPEQAMGQKDLDIRSDIYSLGATFYHMVMGVTPFSGSSNLEIMAKQALESLNSAGMKNKNISPLVLYFIEKMMAKEKDIRYTSPSELIEDIKIHLTGFKAMR